VVGARTLVVYDIPSDKLRNRVAEACKDYGLERIQWSAFLGDLNVTRRRELELRLRRTLGRAPGNIQVYPICDKDMNLRVEIANAMPDRRPGDREEGEEHDRAADRS
jgi:CRISPR-associated protein Cas2